MTDPDSKGVAQRVPAVVCEGHIPGDPVKIAYRNLLEALDALNRLSDKLGNLAVSSKEYDEIYDPIANVMDQLCGWDCHHSYRLIANPPGNKVPSYRNDL